MLVNSIRRRDFARLLISTTVVSLTMSSMTGGVQALSSKATSCAASATIPKSLEVPGGLNTVFASEIVSAPVKPLDFTIGVDSTSQGEIVASEMIQSNTKKHGSIGFIVRRPGCVLCREEGQMLDQLTASEEELMDGFGLFGVVKEVDVDNEGLIEFYEKFYKYPLYLDVDKAFYTGLGNRKLSLTTWNPFRLWRGMKEMGKRLKEKQIEGNMKGEGLVQGGVIIFNANGQPKAVYLEQTGSELPIDEIVQALQAIKNEDMQS